MQTTLLCSTSTQYENRDSYFRALIGRYSLFTINTIFKHNSFPDQHTFPILLQCFTPSQKKFWSCSSIRSFMAIMMASSFSKARPQSDSFKYLDCWKFDGAIFAKQGGRERSSKPHWCTATMATWEVCAGALYIVCTQVYLSYWVACDFIITAWSFCFVAAVSSWKNE